jgi:acyl-CoA thioester hydrolase
MLSVPAVRELAKPLPYRTSRNDSISTQKEEQMTEKKRFEIDIDVRFRDIDVMGHVNNAVFFTYFEQARVQFFKNIFPSKNPNEFAFILAHIRCDYIKPVTLNDRPCLRIGVKALGNKSFQFHYQLVDRADPAIFFATAESVQVCYDYQENRPVPVSEKLRTLLSTYLTTG